MRNLFPKHTESKEKGEKGVRIIDQIISDKYGWIFRRTHQEHDYGIDGYIDIVSEEREVFGHSFAVQIKYGKSFFKNKEKYGYKYLGEKKHINYLINHPTPIIIVICSPDGNCYWEVFSTRKTKKSGNNWSMTIPYDNILNKNGKIKLLKLFSGKNNHLDELENYWLENSIFDQFDYINITITRDDIENFNYTDTINFFERFKVTKEIAYQSEGLVDINIYGYDLDSRELWEIEDVRYFFRNIEPLIKYWFYFLSKNKESYALTLLSLCIVDLEKSPENKIEYNADNFNEFMERNIRYLQEMCSKLSLTQKEYDNLINRIMLYYNLV